MQPEFVPRESGAQPHGLARDAPAEEIVTPDEDPALPVAADPIDPEDPGEAHPLFPAADRPPDLRLAPRRVPEAFVEALFGKAAEQRPPEARDLRPQLPV